MKLFSSFALASLLCALAARSVDACQQGNSPTRTTRVIAGATVTVTPDYDPANIGDQIFPVTVTVNNNSNTPCNIVLSVRRAILPATLVNGANSMVYGIERSGGGSIMHIGATATAATSTAVMTLASDATRTVNLQVRLPAGQSSASIAGIYSDLTASIEVWQVNGVGVPTTLRSSVAMSISASRARTCSLANPSNASQTISVGSNGLTTGMATSPPSFSVTCSIGANIAIASQNGAVTLGNVSQSTLPNVPNFRNKIEYSAAVNAPAGAVTLTTGSIPGAPAVTPSQPFSTSAVANRLTTVTITPEVSVVPLLAGSYSDVLTVSITPQ